jgi:dTDP-4-amino-4,6-dideoxygalactose transaminase
MTEFAAALASVGLGKLPAQNEVRINNARRLEAALAGFDEVSVVKPRPGDVAVYYAVLLRLKEKLVDLDDKLARLQSKGIPIRKTWNLLHRHPHFNQSTAPARGAPWLDRSYSGQMSGVRYCDLRLPVAETYLPERVLELYVHPPAGEAEIDFAAEHIRVEFCGT